MLPGLQSASGQIVSPLSDNVYVFYLHSVTYIGIGKGNEIPDSEESPVTNSIGCPR